MFDKKMKGSRDWSSQRVRDFLLDGDSENTPGVDPLFLEEEGLDIPSHGEGKGGSVCSSISIQTWKSLHTQRTPKTRVADGRTVRSSISSRARQIKDYEGDPFLSVDLLPNTRSSPQTSRKGPARSSCKGGLYSELSASSIGPLSAHSVRRRGELTNGFCSAYLNITRPASFISPVRLPPPLNLRVKMPFKHAISKPVITTTFVAPGQALTENTALAIHVVNKIINEQKPAQVMCLRGHLLKARLKSLEPVNVTGPTIHQCKGIVAETRTYSACSIRTYQRLKSILSEAHTRKNTVQDIKDPLSICESVHRTSQASSPDPADNSVCCPDFDLNQKVLLKQQIEAKIKESDSKTENPSHAALILPVPNSESDLIHCEEAVANIVCPDKEVQKTISKEQT